jgi:hypothetical protein
MGVDGIWTSTQMKIHLEEFCSKNIDLGKKIEFWS